MCIASRDTNTVQYTLSEDTLGTPPSSVSVSATAVAVETPGRQEEH